VYRIDLQSGDFEILSTHPPESAHSGALVLGSDGFIYGQGPGRGAFTADAGAIFRIDPASGEVATLHTFGMGTAPRKPFAVIEADPGSLVATAERGGSADQGLIFWLLADGSIENLHTFTDGISSSGPARTYLVRGSDGLLYGTRSTGGSRGGGMVFSLDASGGYTEMYAFDAAYPHYDNHPSGALIESRYEPGIFYGTVSVQGFGGSVYRVTSAGSLTFLAQLQNWVGEPSGRLLQTEDGWLLGVSAGRYTGRYYPGAIFRSGPSSGYQELVELQWSDGQYPRAGLTARPAEDGTDIFGVTSDGGVSGGERAFGTVFKLDSDGDFRPVHWFAEHDGAKPVGELALAGDGMLYGMTREGGSFGYGTIFAVTRSDGIEIVHNFDHDGGTGPEGALYVASDGNLYGTTAGGGPDGGGVVFRYNLAPKVSLIDGVEIAEGGATTVTADARDPQGGPVTFAWDFDGDGEFDDGDETSFDFVADAPERDGPGDYPLAVRVTDESGVATVATTVVTVDNVAPTVQVTPEDADTAPGEVVLLEVSFIDPGPDTWTATVDWGDGTVDTIDPATSPFTVSHVFSEPGTFTVQISVTDDDGGEGSATATINLGTVEDLIEELIDDVGDLVDDGEINSGRGRSLIAELQVALWFLQWNNGETQAIVRLQLFIKKVEIMITTDQVDPDLGAELIAKANAILDLLRA
jgi:uncharacterized repeat protein (TIGR03803 family)